MKIPIKTLTLVKSENEGEVARFCPTLGHPMDCSLPGSSIHGIFQARVSLNKYKCIFATLLGIIELF